MSNGGKARPVSGPVPCQQPVPAHRRVRADVEVRGRRTSLPASLAIGEESLADDEARLVGQRFALEVAGGNSVVQVFDPVESGRDLCIDDRVDRQPTRFPGPGDGLPRPGGPCGVLGQDVEQDAGVHQGDGSLAPRRRCGCFTHDAAAGAVRPCSWWPWWLETVNLSRLGQSPSGDIAAFAVWALTCTHSASIAPTIRDRAPLSGGVAAAVGKPAITVRQESYRWRDRYSPPMLVLRTERVLAG